MNDGAARMRLLRRRRKDGAVVVPVETSERRVKALIAAGHLRAAARGDRMVVTRDAIAAAIGALLDRLAAEEGIEK